MGSPTSGRSPRETFAPAAAPAAHVCGGCIGQLTPPDQSISSTGRREPSLVALKSNGPHLSSLLDPDGAAEIETVERMNVQMVRRALRVEGTCTGAHGMGLHKMDTWSRKLAPARWR
jgi:hypothetical protein